MSSETWSHEAVRLMQEEHCELGRLLEKTQGEVSSNARQRDRLGDMVNQLSELLETHFRHEEEGGYLKVALDRAPRLIGRADSLLAQHEALQEAIDKIRLLIQSGVESPSWWNRIEADFQSFASQLKIHERGETDLVLEAFTDDIGTKD